MTTPVPLRYGYGTNGFANHRLEDALEVIADLGYDGVALTLDHHHLDPFAPRLAARTEEVARRLDRLGLSVVIETGARYLMDPRHKHEPTLVSTQGRDRRVEYLDLAVRVAADLGAQVVSFWSGILPEDTTPQEGWERITKGTAQVLATAEEHGVLCAVEPEPGMFLDTLAGVTALRRRLGDPPGLRHTIDIGHTVCNEPADTATCVRSVGPLLANVQADDMRPGVHDHLEFGEGDIDLPATLAALREVGYRGLVAVELPRHAHAAPTVAARALAALRAAEATL
ncbi:sugar phosphate isomerase/epimerase family protein [Streptomyces xiamenensis]|uniref:sugar phosphate isomerase/epimerase family protein n=1 Tax=Streptomyces xiamenensis TaxID=408015 RepID=UPI003D72D147